MLNHEWQLLGSVIFLKPTRRPTIAIVTRAGIRHWKQCGSEPGDPGAIEHIRWRGPCSHMWPELDVVIRVDHSERAEGHRDEVLRTEPKQPEGGKNANSSCRARHRAQRTEALRDGSSTDIRNITIDRRLHALATVEQVTRSGTSIPTRHAGSSSPPREPKPNFLFEVCFARTTHKQRRALSIRWVQCVEC